MNPQTASIAEVDPGSGVPLACRRKIASRLLPFLFVAYIVAYLDRANVAFANAYLSADLHFSDAVFGFGAGVFFIGYFILEIPGALLVERWSARLWIARILITWGLCTVLMAFIQTPAHFYSVRFLVGCAEAGFYPGVLVYLTHWFTDHDRARATGAFVMAAPISLFIGAPLSAAILHASWPALSSWRWLFIVQGLPPVALGIYTLWFLTDRPQDALWLTPAQKQWLTSKLSCERDRNNANQAGPWWRALLRRDVLLLAGGHLLTNIAGYSFIFWLPANLRDITHLSASASDLVAALPFGAAVLGLWIAARSSDRTGERKLHACVPMLAAAICMSLTALPYLSGVAGLILLTLTGGAIFAWIPGFWALPTLTLTRDAAAGSIGFINAVGNLGGFFGPFLTGLLRSGPQPRLASAALIAVAYIGGAVLTSLVSTTVSARANNGATQ